MGWQDRPYNQENNGGIPPVVFRLPTFTRLTGGIILLCLASFLLQSFGGRELANYGQLTYRNGLAWQQPWRFITYQYLHANAWHFAINMLFLYFFLPSLELRWGALKAFIFYTLGGIAGGLMFGLLSLVTSDKGLVGASGSIMAAMGAVALFYPERQFLFGIPIRLGVAILGGIYLLSSVADRNLSDSAHLGGLAFGFFAPLIAGPIVAKQAHRYRRRRQQREAEAEIREQEQIDHILEKVSHQGMHSLTYSEKKALKRATERQRQAETTRSARRAH